MEAKNARPWLARIDLSEHEDKILLLLALVVSAVVGLVVVAFVALTERFGHALVTAGSWQRFFSPVIGSLVGGWLLYRFFPDARGSGIPQTRVAMVLQRGYISLRTVIGKFICSSISLGSGIALGREGPSVQIGAGIVSAAGRKLGLREEHVRSLIPVGTAAAVAAAFNTPLAAVLFTLEEILADLHARVVGSVVIGAATSWIVLRLILGDEPLFHVPAYQLVHPIEFLIYALLGLLGGVVSTAFVKLLLNLRILFARIPARWKPFSPAIGGLTVGLLALAVPGVLGVGYNLVSNALNGQMALKVMLLLLALKIIATATCYSSGNAGGIFGPSLFIGAMLGGAVGQVAHTLLPDLTGNAGAYALVGMGAAFAGIVRTPMTSVIMIFEVTRDYTIIVPLMIANMCSYVLAQRLQKTPIYEALSLQDGIRMPSPAHRPEPLTVERAMQPVPTDRPLPADGRVVYPDDTLDAALQLLGATGLTEVAVCSRVGSQQVGVLTSADILAAYREAGVESHPASLAARNWLPTVAAITVAALALISGFVVWQRSHRNDLGHEAYAAGMRFQAQGQWEAAVSSYRNALSQNPKDVEARAALGLALVRLGHYTEAPAYLIEVAKQNPDNGPVWFGLAEVARHDGDNRAAIDRYRRAFAGEWPDRAEYDRRYGQLNYADLLAQAGRRAEAVSLLQSIIEQHGDSPDIGRRAAALVRRIGSPQQAEEAYAALAAHFPADPTAWLGLGDARFAADHDTAALEAYQRALDINPETQAARDAVNRTSDVLRLDPTRRGLSVRERAKRWDAMLERVLGALANCGSTPSAGDARQLLHRGSSIETTDQKMDMALRLWRAADPVCRQDPVVDHIVSKIRE